MYNLSDNASAYKMQGAVRMAPPSKIEVVSTSGANGSPIMDQTKNGYISVPDTDMKDDLKGKLDEDVTVKQDKDKIGSGGHGSVFPGILEWASERITTCAIKYCDWDSDKATTQRREIATLQTLNRHRNIVDFYGFELVSKPDGSISGYRIFMDRMETDLHKLYKTSKFKSSEHKSEIIEHVAFSAANGLADIFKNHKIVHRDVKPSNILLDCSGNVKLTDFGVSRDIEKSEAATYVGTHGYLAPEMRQSAANQKYSYKVDIWALGITLFEVVIGRHPCPNGIQGREAAPSLNVNHEIDGESFKILYRIVSFVNRCLIKDVINRATYDVLRTSDMYKEASKAEQRTKDSLGHLVKAPNLHE